MNTGSSGREPHTPSAQELGELHQLIGSYRVSQAIYVVARLGIADLLSDGPKGSEELAQATGAHAGALFRVMRLLAGIGLFDEIAPRRFSLTSLGAGLRAKVPGSRRGWALLLIDEFVWQSWGHLFYSVETGEAAFNHVHHTGIFDYLRQHPDTAANFHAAMTALTAGAVTPLTDRYDFSHFERIVDVGCGQGGLLATVLQACLTPRGVVFDQPEVVAGAAEVLEKAGVAERCQIVGGDFFDGVPPDGDAYVLRLDALVKNWSSAREAEKCYGRSVLHHQRR